MGDGSKSIGYEITGENASFVRAMEGCAAAATAGTAQIKGALESIGKAFAAVQAPLMALSAIVAGGAFFKDAMGAANKLNGEVGNLGKRLGITGEQASTLNTALKAIGTDSETYVDAFGKFAKQLKTNEDGLQAMGLRTRDANGNLRDSNELFTEAVQEVGKYKPGLDQTTAAMTLFGKGVDDAMKLGKLNNTVLEEARKKNEALGLTITKEGVEAGRQYKKAMADLGDVFTAIKVNIGSAVMPVFAAFGEMLASTGPYVIAVFRVALTGVVTALRVVEGAVKTFIGVMRETLSGLMDWLGGLSQMLAAVFRGDFEGAAKAWQQMGQRMGQTIRGVVGAAKDAAIDAGRGIASDFQRIWGHGTAVDAPKGGTKTMGEFKPDKGKDAHDPGRMPAWDAELEEKKLKLAEVSRAEGSLREMSKQEELAYWDAIRSRADLTERERIAVRRKSATLGLDIMRSEFDAHMEQLRTERDELGKNHAQREQVAVTAYQETVARYGAESKEARKAYGEVLAEHRAFLQQQRELDQIESASKRAAAAAEVELQRIALQEQEQLGLLTRTQVLQQEQQLQEQLHEIRLEALQERRALIDPDRDPVAYAQANAQIEQEELQHRQRLAQIRTQTLVQQRAPVLQAMGSIESSWAGLIQKLATGSLTIGGFVKGMFQAVAQSIVQVLAQMAARWMMQKAALLLFDKTTGLSEISTEAAKAGAGGVASMAAAPFPLNLSAPAFGAAMSMAALSFAPVASASGGYDIPAGVNPVTQLHAREMVLPAQHADVIRSLAESQTSAGGGGSLDVTIKAVPMPGNFFMVHRTHLVAALKAARRDFNF